MVYAHTCVCMHRTCNCTCCCTCRREHTCMCARNTVQLWLCMNCVRWEDETASHVARSNDFAPQNGRLQVASDICVHAQCMKLQRRLFIQNFITHWKAARLKTAPSTVLYQHHEIKLWLQGTFKSLSIFFFTGSVYRLMLSSFLRKCLLNFLDG